MGRGRKPKQVGIVKDWESVFWENLPSYISIMRFELKKNKTKFLEVKECIEKLPFTIPKGLHSKEILTKGAFPVISQSKDYSIGFSNRKELLVKDCLPLVVFGDHSKTIKYVNHPFIIGADGVKLLKPKTFLNTEYFYYFLFGVITETKDYGRHYKLLKEGYIPLIKSKEEQNSIVNFINDLKNNSLVEKIYFNKEIESKIISRHQVQVQGSFLAAELNKQLELIKRLRQSFLREGMQGKLVKQYPKDESASILLEKVKAKKERLLKEKKIKKQKSLPPITKDEIPFEIPESWIWLRLGEVTEKIGSGSTPKGSNYSEKGYPFFRSQNVHDDGLVYNDIKYISNDVQKKMSSTVVYPNDLLLNITGGSLGRCAHVPLEFIEGNVSQHVCIIRPILCDNSFIHKLILSPLVQQYIFSSTTGAGRVGLPKYNLEQFVIPLPPFSEQQRIVAKLDELIQHCDALEVSIKESQTQNELLLKQVLTEAIGLKFVKEIPQNKALKEEQKTSKFDPNTTLMEIVELLKKHGKLHAEELWKMSKYPDDIDAFYAELKIQIEINNTVKESKEKGYLELV